MDASLKKREWRIKNKELIDEKNKAYYEANKNRCKINATRYYELHRDEILEFKKQQYKETCKAIFTCECGSTCKELSRKQHLNSKKHKKFVSL
jgi:hypothetical protein